MFEACKRDYHSFLTMHQTPEFAPSPHGRSRVCTGEVTYRVSICHSGRSATDRKLHIHHWEDGSIKIFFSVPNTTPEALVRHIDESMGVRNGWFWFNDHKAIGFTRTFASVGSLEELIEDSPPIAHKTIPGRFEPPILLSRFKQGQSELVRERLEALLRASTQLGDTISVSI